MTEQFDTPSDEDLARWERALAPRAFNRTWELLDAEELSREQEEEMLAASFAQRYLWYLVGDARNRAIADWQVSRVAAVLGYAELARRFGERSLEVSVENALDPFVTGFAHEAIARAAADVDDVETFTEHIAAARALLAEIEDDDERDLLTVDLAEMSEE
ncbi:MAG TPA: hypothetical protein VFS66_15455 [Acidimicrobiia bacterium]|nr:hypothetical protein [Acidimicrobiia bacterium]